MPMFEIQQAVPVHAACSSTVSLTENDYVDDHGQNLRRQIVREQGGMHKARLAACLWANGLERPQAYAATGIPLRVMGKIPLFRNCPFVQDDPRLLYGFIEVVVRDTIPVVFIMCE